MNEGFIVDEDDEGGSTVARNSLDRVATKYVGLYEVFRRSEKSGERAVRSALQIYRSEGDPRLYFRAAYRSEHDNGVCAIEGLVLPNGTHMWFLGYDTGSGAPYIYATLRMRGQKKFDLPGLMLRFTQSNDLIGARLQARPVEGSWEDALKRVAFIGLDDVPADLHSSISNKITGTTFALTIASNSTAEG